MGDGYSFTQDKYNTTPAASIAANLSLSQDAARADLGVPWRMPTAADFQELYDNCTTIWTTLNGVAGRMFVSNVNGQSIFFPAAGYCSGQSLFSRGSLGLYWSSTYFSAIYARNMNFNNLNVTPQSSYDRRLGFPVRAVYPPV